MEKFSKKSCSNPNSTNKVTNPMIPCLAPHHPLSGTPPAPGIPSVFWNPITFLEPHHFSGTPSLFWNPITYLESHHLSGIPPPIWNPTPVPHINHLAPSSHTWCDPCCPIWPLPAPYPSLAPHCPHPKLLPLATLLPPLPAPSNCHLALLHPAIPSLPYHLALLAPTTPTLSGSLPHCPCHLAILLHHPPAPTTSSNCHLALLHRAIPPSPCHLALLAPDSPVIPPPEISVNSLNSGNLKKPLKHTLSSI